MTRTIRPNKGRRLRDVRRSSSRSSMEDPVVAASHGSRVVVAKEAKTGTRERVEGPRRIKVRRAVVRRRARSRVSHSNIFQSRPSLASSRSEGDYSHKFQTQQRAPIWTLSLKVKTAVWTILIGFFRLGGGRAFLVDHA